MRNLRYVAIRAAISFVLASALWAFVNFSENPDQQRSFEDLPIAVENVPPGLVMVDEAGIPVTDLPLTADVTVVAPLEIFSRVTRSSIQPYIDLSGFESGTHLVNVNVRPNLPQLRISAIDPEEVPVRLEREVTSTVPLSVRLIGQPPFSYEARQPQVSNSGSAVERVTIAGPASQMRLVETARIDIDISGQTNTIQAQRQPVPIDANGRTVAGISVQPSNVEVRVPIISSAGIKRVPVLAQWRGVPADGHALIRITPDPAFIEIVGRAAILDNVNLIETDPVNISGASEPFTTTAVLLIPDGVALANPEVAEVQVAVVIEPVDLTFSLSLNIPVVSRNVADGLSVSVEPQLLPITLTGSAQSLKALRPGDLEAVINLQGLAPGTYTLDPQVSLPPGLQVEGGLPPVTVSLAPVATVTPIEPTPVITDTQPITPTEPLTVTPTP